MFGNNVQQSLVHLSGKPAQDNDPQLPRGECGFLLPEAGAGNGSRQRCSCRSFYPDSVVRSRCGCGHQAWHHEHQSVAAVSIEEHAAVIEEMKRLRQEIKRFENLEQELKQELFKERMSREEHFKIYRGIEAGLYENMKWLKVHMDDKVEAVVDKTQEFNDQIKSVQEKLTLVDEVTMELENRIDRVEHSTGASSREVTPQASTPKAPPVPQLPLLLQPHHTFGQLPIRTDKKYPLSWNVRVIFVPRKALKFAYDPDSNAYRRCASRNLHQTLEFPSQDSSCFANAIETSFKGIIRGRRWMPMTAHRPADEPFGRMALTWLPQDLTVRDVWDYPFLEDHCIAHDKMQGDVLYITLQYEDVTWQEIRFLPSVLGADESCWSHDEELDGIAKYKSLDSEIMALSKLDVLADSASMLSRVQTNYSSERSSLRSFETEETDDEHRDKKPKLRPKQSMPNINGSGTAVTPMYVSGRSKRKMPVREKGVKEPLHFNVTNVAKWRPNLLHPHSSKGKEAAESH
ncbi:uncharacterized protein BDR25DRAFT_42759 [Lindgomyces ingoldianus]|uniref:Uncharacterized protein n=1 Tax=Lindgomyces ingoldianus TaxID=673940 RepID=A0ACB6RD61_9PLEO|nr:uncharacterized protein BDR25DRAFT_42759 [Lindgomyces ingoldianus]KAF2476985.1 hypothetical protein BDR25DRAFT_42759 [Lindgomyces ingoldianus]